MSGQLFKKSLLLQTYEKKSWRGSIPEYSIIPCFTQGVVTIIPIVICITQGVVTIIPIVPCSAIIKIYSFTVSYWTGRINSIDL